MPRQTRPLALLRCCATAALLLAAGACTPNYTVVYDRTIEQAALVPPPTGPIASGPLVPRNKVALEGALSLSPAARSGIARADGEVGHNVLSTLATLRVALGVENTFETGWSFELADGDWSRAIAGEDDDGLVGDEFFVRFGPQLRVLVAGDRSLGLGINGEALFASVAYRRDITETQTVYTYGEAGCCGGAVGQRAGPETSRVEHHRTFVPFWRGGLFVTAELPVGLSLGGGVLAQTHPYFFGSAAADQVCDYYDGGRICDGVSPADVDPFSQQVVGTSYVTIGVELGLMVVLGEVWVNFAGEPRLVEPSRLGGEIGLRFNL